MSNFSELTVIIKDEEKTLKKKYAIYSKYSICDDDPVIKQCIEETLKYFDGELMNVIVNIKIVKT